MTPKRPIIWQSGSSNYSLKAEDVPNPLNGANCQPAQVQLARPLGCAFEAAKLAADPSRPALRPGLPHAAVTVQQHESSPKNGGFTHLVTTTLSSLAGTQTGLLDQALGKIAEEIEPPRQLKVGQVLGINLGKNICLPAEIG
ncbi:hypothetical protein PtA15_3A430 [Puccinia triticina]|uniref:Uncharacterized protein n=1 Tax=Puccinia triticina TaxID=208348 RepID=A0ABY7CCW2_9BASI|nr:uncharacterized protein PtA15_3A430 [Puccinia triticina]WAQ83063.1 hypothetical protein PtA15_3A430 [Puccinia triticina]